MKKRYTSSLIEILRKRGEEEGEKSIFLLCTAAHFIKGTPNSLVRAVRKRHINKNDVNMISLLEGRR